MNKHFVNFLEKANKFHNNKYDYSKAEYISMGHKITIICPIHGEFQQVPGNHIRNRACPKCNDEEDYNKRVRIFLEKANKFHNNKYDYSKVDYVDAHTKVTIICPRHGEFQQSPNAHITHGCAKCAVEDSEHNINQKRKAKETFIPKSNEVHNNKYDYSKVEYVDPHTKVTIICPIHGEFQQRPSHHLCGNGCSECGKLSWKNNSFNFVKKYQEIDMGKEMGHLYQLRIFDECESFYKVGITRNSISERYQALHRSNYSYEVIDDISLTNLETAIIEQTIHDSIDDKYQPARKFRGSQHECYADKIDLNLYL